MSKIREEQYKDILLQQAKEFNKRMGWVDEMEKLEQYKPFSITPINSRYYHEIIDLRDLKSLSSLIELRGSTEEEQKKNFQDDVFAMREAFLNGPIEKTAVYLDKLIDLQFNFDEKNLDYTKKEDVFKAISCAALGQCFGSKREEFLHYYNSKINTKELKEKYYYRNIALKDQIDDIFNAVNSQERLNITVTLFGADFSFDQTYTKNHNTVTERDLKQVELSLNGEDEVVNLDYIVNKSYEKANDPNATNKSVLNDMAVTLGIDLLFQDIIIPGGTEGKRDLENGGFIYQNAVFVNGKPLEEAVKGSKFDVEKETTTRRMIPYLAQQLTDPTSMIEVCKLIPIGAGEFKKQFITIHKDFSQLNPALQKQHDDAYNAYIKDGYKAHRENETKHLDKVFDTVKVKVAQQYISQTSKIEDPQREGKKPTYNNFDPYFENKDFVKDALSRIEHVFTLGHKFEKVASELDVANMNTIELRQGIGMALIMAGKNATDEEIFKKRIEILNAYKAGGEFQKEYNRKFVNKVLSYDISKTTFSNSNDLYEYLVFVLGSSAVSNIFEQDKELEKEFNSNPITQNEIALRAVYTNGVNEFLGGKAIECMDGIAHGTFVLHQFDVMGMTDATSLCSLESKRILFDITNAKINTILKDEAEHTIKLPYFLAGNACGSEGDYYSFEQTQKTADDYLACYSVDKNEMFAPTDSLDRANVDVLSISTGCALYSSIYYSLQTNNKDNIAEFADANKMDSSSLTELCTYINGISLKELVDSKVNDAIASNHLNPETMNNRESAHLRKTICECLLTEAATNPQKNISLVCFKSNENNEIEVKTTLLKKDYSAMVKQDYKQHSFGEKVLHFFHLIRFDGDRVASMNKETIRNYKAQNQSLAITESFKSANKDLLLMHQAKYAATENLKEKAFNELKLSEKTIRNIREQFLNEKVEINEVEKDAKVSRPTLDKLSSVSQSIINKKDNYSDDLETENFNRKYKNEIEQIVVDVKENETEDDDIVEMPPDSYQEENSFLKEAEELDDLVK